MNQYAEVQRNKAGGSSLGTAIRLAIAAATLVSLPAFATLGGNSASVTADQTALQATMITSAKEGYTDYALTLPSGIIVHEFVNSANQVFEVTWNGIGMRPDMKQILGSYFTQLTPHEDEKLPTSRHFSRVGAKVEIHSEAHNRVFTGTAHIASMMPSSLSAPIRVPAERVSVRKPNNVAR